jgi:hypothetical protein
LHTLDTVAPAALSATIQHASEGRLLMTITAHKRAPERDTPTRVHAQEDHAQRVEPVGEMGA